MSKLWCLLKDGQIYVVARKCYNNLSLFESREKVSINDQKFNHIYGRMVRTNNFV